MNFGKAVYLFAGIFFFSTLSLTPLHATHKDVRRLVRSDGMEIEVFEFGKGRETLIMAAGNGRDRKSVV
jgi:hypothetical protein